MSPISELILKVLPSGTYELSAPLTYQGRRDRWVIPAGFQTDLASVPRIFWTFFPPHGRYSKAAVVHDWLYVERPLCRISNREAAMRYLQRAPELKNCPPLHTLITRHQADGVFRRIMRELGVSWWRRYMMWAAVRLGGWYGWRQRRAAQR